MTLLKTLLNFLNANRKLRIPYFQKFFKYLQIKQHILMKRERGERGREMYFTRVGTLIVATIYLQLIQNRYMFRSFTDLQCSHRHCLQPVASDVEVVGYL